MCKVPGVAKGAVGSGQSKVDKFVSISFKIHFIEGSSLTVYHTGCIVDYGQTYQQRPMRQVTNPAVLSPSLSRQPQVKGTM